MLGRLAVTAADRRIDDADEPHPRPVQQAGGPAVEPLGRQGDVPDDPVSLGLEHNPLSPRVGAHQMFYRRLSPGLEPAAWVGWPPPEERTGSGQARGMRR